MSVSGSVAYDFATTATATRTRFAKSSVAYGWTVAATAHAPRIATAAASYHWAVSRPVCENNVHLQNDRFRIVVQESRTKKIVCRDLTVTKLIVQRALSGPCDVEFDVSPYEQSVQGIYFRPWEQYIHVEKVMMGKRRLWATAIVQPSDIDPKTGTIHLKAKGFATYPKGLPWLEDINWLANDAFDPIVEIWRYLQSYDNGDLGVDVIPKKSGVVMLPGYAFDGNLLNLNFFATFVRATDKLDCGDYIDAMAKDIPFDYREQSQWNAAGTDVIKTIELGYPRLGKVQETLAFVINENVMSANPYTETQIDWVSDVGVTGWFPGVEYSYELANADPKRLRRYLNEEDAFLDSNERTQAWAGRRLARRQTPAYWQQITIDMDHPNAPLGSFDVGDTITVRGWMPWEGNVSQEHKIIGITIDEKQNQCTLTMYAEGAFNYQPIYFPGATSNIIENAGFNTNLNGWTLTGPWQWVGSEGNKGLGCATITADGSDYDLITQSYGLNDFQIFEVSGYVKCTAAQATGDAIQLVAQFYDDNQNPTQAIEVASVTPNGLLPWKKLAGNVLTPVGSTHVALRLHVDKTMTAGQVYFDDADLEL